MRYYVKGTNQEIDILGWVEDSLGLLEAYALDIETGETIYIHESNIDKR